MEGSVLSFLKAEWKVSNTGSAHWVSSSIYHVLECNPYDMKKKIISLDFKF
jgi:hypothetical protein